jgi:hypothetical protein
MSIEHPMCPPRAGATKTKEEAWHRRHALQVACSLPDSPEDSLIIFRLATQLVTDFMMLAGADAKAPGDRALQRAARRQYRMAA